MPTPTQVRTEVSNKLVYVLLDEADIFEHFPALARLYPNVTKGEADVAQLRLSPYLASDVYVRIFESGRRGIDFKRETVYAIPDPERPGRWLQNQDLYELVEALEDILDESPAYKRTGQRAKLFCYTLQGQLVPLRDGTIIE